MDIRKHLKALPKLYATEDTEHMVPVKLFDPCGGSTWFLLEWDGEDTLFCWACLNGDLECAELGYQSLSELESFRGPLGLGIEVDLHWTPKPLEEAKRELKGRIGL